MKRIPIIILAVLVVVAVFLTVTNKKNPDDQITPTPSISPNVSNLIKVEEPKNNQLVKSPVIVKGEARGNWYFEASFPIKIYDANGLELVALPAQAKGEWMTEDFVPFEVSIEFKKPTTKTGTLVLQKDNPSGLPEHDADLRIPISFDLDNWVDPIIKSQKEGCFVAGCSSQLCVEESEKDVVTTCEFKQEYACYKDAKCARQEDGKCGWTPNEQLVACLYKAWGAPAE